MHQGDRQPVQVQQAYASFVHGPASLLHAGAYWLMWSLRSMMPKRSTGRVTQFDTLRLRLIKIAVTVVEMRTQIRLSLPTACPCQPILHLVLGRLPPLVT